MSRTPTSRERSGRSTVSRFAGRQVLGSLRKGFHVSQTFKYTGSDRIEVPSLGIRFGEGDTFEVPDEFAARFESDPEFVSSRVKSPDAVPDPSVVAAVTGQIPVQPAPAA